MTSLESSERSVRPGNRNRRDADPRDTGPTNYWENEEDEEENRPEIRLPFGSQKKRVDPITQPATPKLPLQAASDTPQTILKLHSSRFAELFREKSLVNFIFAPQIILNTEGIRTVRHLSFWAPWRTEREFVDFSKVSTVRHITGFFWDTLILETKVGSYDIELHNLPKKKTRQLVDILEKLT